MLNFNAQKFRTNLHDLGKSVNVITTGRWMFYCVLVGIFAGLAALLFNVMLNTIQLITLSHLAGIDLLNPSGQHNIMHIPLPSIVGDSMVVHSSWLIILLPAVGALISGLLVYKFAPDAEGSGTDSVIRAFHKQKGKIKPIVIFVKFFASIFTIGTGGSAGKEGPIAHVGAGIGSYLAEKFGLSEKERKILLMAGMGAGIGAIFKAPIGGALFSIEVMYRKDMENEGLVATIISSIIGYSVYASFDGWDSIFTFQSLAFTNPYELPLYILLAIVLVMVGIIYAKVFDKTKRLFANIELPVYIKPALGGLAVGGIAFFYPSVLGSSYGSLQAALNGNLTISFMLLLAIIKMIATVFTVNSGGSGGVFAPSLVIGGLLGGAFGLGINVLLPGTIGNPTAFVLVGMGAFFAAAANVPVSSTILITEMSKSYGLLVPLIFASAIAYLGSQNWSIYKEQIEDRYSSSDYRGAFLNNILQSIKVHEAYQQVENLPTVSQSSNVHQVLETFGRSGTLVLPVKNDDEDVVGMVSLYDVRSLLAQEDNNFIIAADLMVGPKFLTMNDPLEKAFQYFITTGEPELLVTQHGSDNKFVGVLSEKDFLIAYERAISGQKVRS